jgi:hypothetical protein
MVAGLHGRHGRTDPLNDTGTLVPEHAGQRERQPAAGDGEVGVAEAGGDHANEDFVCPQFVKVDVGQSERSATRFDDGGPGAGHDLSLLGERLKGLEATLDQSSEITTDFVRV